MSALKSGVRRAPRGARGLHAGIGLVVVRLHEDLIRADARSLDSLETRVVERGRVHVRAPDFAVPAGYVVDVANATGDEIGVVAWVLAEHHDEALVPLLLHGHHLLADLIHAQRAANHVLVLALKPTVGAIVHAQIAEIERRKEHDA